MQLRDSLIVGTLWGIALAIGFTALLLFAVGLRSLTGAPPPGVAELPIIALVIAYFVGGITAGGILGVLWPRTKRPLQAVMVGILMAIFFVTAVRIAIHGATGWTTGDLLQLAGTSLIAGSCVGLVLWASNRRFLRLNGSP